MLQVGRMRFRFALFWLALWCLAGEVVHAEWNGYVGADVYVSNWQMGFASGKAVNVFGSQFNSNKATPNLYMAGLSLSLLYNKTWAFSYQGEAGGTKTDIALSRTSAASGFEELKSTPNIFRTDHNLAISRVLGASGFSVFLGGKVQYFGYEHSNGQYTNINAGTTVPGTFSSKTSILNYGPAAGLAYMFPFVQKSFISVQAGVVYFVGNYGENVNLSVPGRPVPANNPILEQVEKFTGFGYTALVSFIKPLSQRLLFQLSLRGQYYTTKTKTLDVSANVTLPTTATASEGAMNDVSDLLIGGQLAVIYRMF